MALTSAMKVQLAGLGLPSELDMVKRTRGFMVRAGLTMEDLAEAIGYSRPSLNLFLTSNYDAHHPHETNTRAIRAALKEFMDLHDVEKEILLNGTHYDTSDYLAIRNSAVNALKRGKAYLMDGPPGTQKTWILRQIEREVNSGATGQAVYIYARVQHTPFSFLKEICANAGLAPRGTIDQLIRKLRFFLGKKRTLLMVDEAQHLSSDALEVLRQLLDLPPYFGVILAGSHDLSQRLSHWQMEQWRSRLRRKYLLNGLTEKEAMLILSTELAGIPKDLIRQTIDDSRSEASRDNKKFSYISARNLFDAIEAAKTSLAAGENGGRP